MKPILLDGRQLAALTVAGSDSGGNAGVQADVRAFHTFGLHACTVLAALTAQNPFGVAAVHVPDPAFVAAQLDAVLPVYALGAVKTGMLATREVVLAVVDRLCAAATDIPLVVDPVMVATSGAKLLRDDAAHELVHRLVPLATLVTPNLPEAEVLAGGFAIRSRADMAEAARRIEATTGAGVLVKGGHAADAPAEDLLYTAEGAWWLSTPVVEHPASTHGTGCSLSAAIAAALARGRSLPDAVADGKAYVYESIRTSLPVGPEATVLGMPDLADPFDHPFVRMAKA